MRRRWRWQMEIIERFNLLWLSRPWWISIPIVSIYDRSNDLFVPACHHRMTTRFYGQHIDRPAFTSSSSEKANMLAHIRLMLIAKLNSYRKFEEFSFGDKWVSRCPEMKVKVPRFCLTRANVWPRSQRIKICRQMQTFRRVTIWIKNLHINLLISLPLVGICFQTNTHELRCLTFTDLGVFGRSHEVAASE